MEASVSTTINDIIYELVQSRKEKFAQFIYNFTEHTFIQKAKDDPFYKELVEDKKRLAITVQKTVLEHIEQYQIDPENSQFQKLLDSIIKTALEEDDGITDPTEKIIKFFFTLS